MQLTAPLPSLPDHGFREPPLAFETNPTSSAVSSLNMLFKICWPSLVDTLKRTELKLEIEEHDLSFAGSPENHIVLENGLLLVPQTDFSALLLRQTKSSKWECFYQPLRLTKKVGSKQSRLTTQIYSACDFWASSGHTPGFHEDLKHSLQAVVTHWDQNPTFDLAIKGSKPNLAWALPVNTVFGHWACFREEVECVVKDLEMKGFKAPADLFIWMRSLRPDGTLTDLRVVPDRKKADTPKYQNEQERKVFEALRPRIIAALSHPDCPVPARHQIYPSSSSFPTASYYYHKPVPVSAHRVLETASRIQEALSSAPGPIQKKSPCP